MTAAIVSLIVARLYPDRIFSPQSVRAEEIVSPLPKEDPQYQIKTSPSAIYFKPFDLTLPIAQGVISNDEWTLYDDKVSWLATSATPEKGNVILYAHNKENLFGPLKNIEIGDEIIVEHDQKTYTYVVSKKHQVLPTDVDAVVSDKNQLTLYTCDGSFDQKRLIVTALPK
ncbi:sortase [Candidatus Daviesbacteria bacterium]|nr:sortase [Candidatus Daviesbacteria bacterium]